MLIYIVVVVFLLSLFLLLWYEVRYKTVPADVDQYRYLRLLELYLRFSHYYPVRLAGLVSTSWQLKLTRFNAALTKALFDLLPRPERYKLKVTRERFDGVPVIVYEPLGPHRKNDGAVVYIHGGGFVMFDAAYNDRFLYDLVGLLGCVVVSVDYRLAPEHPFPSALDDCEKATAYFIKNCKWNYEADPGKLVIVGESAGGNLAAVTCLRLNKRRRELPAVPRLQVLIYPFMQAVDMQSPSHQQYSRCYPGTSLLQPEYISRWCLHYLLGWDVTKQDVEDFMANLHITVGARQRPEFKFVSHERIPVEFCHASVYRRPTQLPGKPQLYEKLEKTLFNPEFCPLFAGDDVLHDMPNALVLTFGCDVLRDDGIWYVRRLQEAQSHVKWKHYPMGCHGSIILDFSPLVGEMKNDIVEFILPYF